MPSSCIREIAALKDIKHPNVVDLIDVSYSSSYVHLIFEYIPLDLEQFIK